jgi:hypothetical protein
LETLLNYSKRIKARAIRRVGELYNEIEPAKTGPKVQEGTLPKLQDGTVPQLGRTAVADAAGLSERQRKTAARVANVPADEFEAAVESDNPPTIEDLAECGTKKKTVIETKPAVEVQPAVVRPSHPTCQYRPQAHRFDRFNIGRGVRLAGVDARHLVLSLLVLAIG